MTKYRIRLKSGRVLGPFERHQLLDLKAKGHIKGGEEAQVFPTGNWGPIEVAEFWKDLADPGIPAKAPLENTESTFVIDLAKLREKKQEKELEAYDQGDNGPLEEMTQTVRLSPTEHKVSLSQLQGQKASVAPVKNETSPTISAANIQRQIDEAEDTAHQEELKEENKTLINPVAQQEIERMRKLQLMAQEKARAEEEARKRNEEEKNRMALVIAQENAPVSADEATQMLKIDKHSLLETAAENELSIELELEKIRKKAEKEQKAQEEAEEEEPKNPRLKRILIFGAIAAIVFALLFPDEEPKKKAFLNIEPKIIFPIPFDQADENKSTVEFNNGVEAFNKGTYPNLVKAGLHFKNAYENNIDNNAALSFMVRAYAEELRYSKQKQADLLILFNLIQTKRPFLMQDPNGVIGVSLFYMAINKPDSAVDVVNRYFRSSKNYTQDLFAVHLMNLMKQGRIDQTKKFVQPLLNQGAKGPYSPYTYRALTEFYRLNEEPAKAMDLVLEAMKKYPKIVDFYLLRAEMLIKSGKVDEAVGLIKVADEMNLGYNNLTRSKFFELKGFVYSLKGKPQEAAKYFTYALKLNDNDSLRVLLSNLETTAGTNAEADKLILESKAVKHLMDAKEFFSKKNYELAMSAAAKATDAMPFHIPSELFLAKTQLKLGLAREGLATLQALLERYPDDKVVNLAMIDAYIETYKFADARTRIQIISSQDYRDGWEFASLNAKLQYKMGDTLQAMSWLKNAINLNPLNDADIFSLSQILLKKANFDAAKVLLNKCMELDPVNPEYRIAYSRLIYETRDDVAAIGYLLSLKEDFGEDPKVLSEIAIMYYRSGKLTEFQDYKAKLEKEHATDKALYEFLIKAALLDERNADIPPLVEKILAVEPGDLESMMTAGRVLFESGKLVEAAKWFARVKDKLPSYPKVLYYIAKIDFLSGDVEGALKKLQENIKANGESDDDLVFLAQIFQSKEDFVAAETNFKKAQKINPKSYDAIVGLADLSTKRNNHDLALDLYKRAMKLRQDEPMVHKKIGDVYRQLGQGALAIEAYKQYLEMDPESPHKSNLENYINLMK